MRAKLIILVMLGALLGVLSCSDESVQPQKTETVSPPPTPRTVTLTSRMRASTLKTAGIYYMSAYPTGSWTYLGTVSSTGCSVISNFSANDGDVLYFAVFDGPTGVSYHARAGTCASTSDTSYCGDPAYGSGLYHVTISGVNVSVGIQVNVVDGDFLVCL